MDLLRDIHTDDDKCVNLLGHLFGSDDDATEPRVSGSIAGRAPNIEQGGEAAE